jgi:hypothetical protein
LKDKGAGALSALATVPPPSSAFGKQPSGGFAPAPPASSQALHGGLQQGKVPEVVLGAKPKAG